jgi:enoyl-CoA hydratase/carnithine racemase
VSTTDVLFELSEGILALTFNRPARKNALTEEMYIALAGALEGADADDRVRCILIQGEGDTFTAGNDISEFVKAGAVPPGVRRFIRALVRIEKPVVAAVQGFAVGIGTTMLLHCDVVCVSEDAKLMAPFVDLALAPEAASSLLMPLRIGYGRAFSLFALGATLRGSDAATLGLAHSAVPATEVKSTARTLAKTLCQKPTGSIRATKRLMREMLQLDFLVQREFDVVSARLTTPEAKEAFLAFQEKRKPNFSGLAQ